MKAAYNPSPDAGEAATITFGLGAEHEAECEARGDEPSTFTLTATDGYVDVPPEFEAAVVEHPEVTVAGDSG